MFPAVLFLRLTNVEISLKSPLSTFDEFGFTTEGVYSLTVNSSAVSPLVFGLLTSSELKDFNNDSLNETAVLSGAIPIAGIQTLFSDPRQPLTGTISTKDVYTIFVYTGADSDSATAVLSADFANGASRLDSRAAPILIEHPIALGLFATVLLFWLVNWYQNRNLRISIHYCLTGMYIAGVLSRGARLFYIEYTDVHDSSAGPQLVSILFRVLFQLFLYVAILLCAKGWCIVRQRINLSELARAVSLAAVFLVVQTVLAYAGLGDTVRVVFILVMLALLGLYARELLRSSQLASLYIYAYLLEISNSGIDPETTPVWEMMQMFESLQLSIIVYVSLMIVQMIVAMFAGKLQWVTSLAEDVADFGGAAALAVVYRLRGGNRNGFVLIRDDAESGELALADIETTPERGVALRKGGRKWEPETALPPPPGTGQQNVVTIETPDGAFEIAMRVEPAPAA